MAATIASLVLTSSAAALEQAYRFLDTTFSATGPWTGTRATLNNPSSGQRQISENDFFITSVFAHDNALQNGMQTGILYEFRQPLFGPDCDKGMDAPEMYYFTEIVDLEMYTCFFTGFAATAESWRQTVMRPSDGFWRSYRGGAFNQGITTRWDESCGGLACEINAFAEEANSRVGEWYAKFAGGTAATGNHDTPWQRFDGSAWTTIDEAQVDPHSNHWSDPSGPFPDGIWHFRYFCCPTSIKDWEIGPVGDTFVAEEEPSNNYGSLADINVAHMPRGGSGLTNPCLSYLGVCRRDGLLKFDTTLYLVPGFHILSSVKLRLCASSSSPTGDEVSLTAGSSWDESTVSWNSAPATTPGAVSLGPVVAGTCYDVDVTDLVWNTWFEGNGVWSFRVSSSQFPSDTRYASREGNTALRPKLLIKVF